MSDVNKQLLDAVRHCHGIFDQYVSHHLAKPDYDKAAANERHRAICAEAIAAAEQAQQAEPSKEWFNFLIEDVSAIDCMYRGDPTYEHDAYWMKNHVIKMLEKRRDTCQLPDLAASTIKLGLHGREYDTPQTRRAYTYREQPDNIGAYKLGRAVLRAASGGDSIDYGLSLLKHLQAEGFGVFELGDQQEGGA